MALAVVVAAATEHLAAVAVVVALAVSLLLFTLTQFSAAHLQMHGSTPAAPLAALAAPQRQATVVVAAVELEAVAVGFILFTTHC